MWKMHTSQRGLLQSTWKQLNVVGLIVLFLMTAVILTGLYCSRCNCNSANNYSVLLKSTYVKVHNWSYSLARVSQLGSKWSWNLNCWSLFSNSAIVWKKSGFASLRDFTQYLSLCFKCILSPKENRCFVKQPLVVKSSKILLAFCRSKDW